MRAFRLLAVVIMAWFFMGHAQTALAAEPARVAPKMDKVQEKKAVQGGPVLDRILERKELIVGTAASMPPLNMTFKDGQIEGIEIELARLIAEAMEVKLIVKKMLFNDLLPALQAGQVDMVLSAMTITPARNLKFAFVGPYFNSGKSLLTRMSVVESVNEPAKINTPDKVLTALKGSTSQIFAQKLFPAAKLILTDDYDQAISLVRESKAHALVADMPICQLSVHRYPGAGLVTLSKALSYEPLGIAIPANDPLLVNWLQNFLGILDKEGILQMISDKYFKDNSWISRLP
jgi:polar amino acid transport system substrate-binding protein